MERRFTQALSPALIVSIVLVNASMINIPKTEEADKLIVDTIIVRPVLEIESDYQDLLYGDFICKYHFQSYPGAPGGVSLHMLESGQIITICHDVVGPSPPGTQFVDSLWFSFVGDYHSLEIVHAVVTISVSFWEYHVSGSSTQRIDYGADAYHDTLSVPVVIRESK